MQAPHTLEMRSMADILPYKKRFQHSVQSFIKGCKSFPALECISPLTLFAPTNVAFTLLDLPEDTPVEMIGNVLLYHIANEMVELENGKIDETVSGNVVLIADTVSEIKINDPAITESIPASNGIIYVIGT
jgi:uncharacterized surface protein with fasciclin (FAS1) repeats